MNTSILILCGGDNTGWRKTGGAGRKELAATFGVPLLARTIRQFKAEGCRVLVAGRCAEIKTVAEAENATLLPCAETKTETCLLNIKEWTQQTVFVCGDTVFSDDLVVELSCSRSPMFYGSFFTSEIYAVMFEHSWHGRMKNWLAACHPGSGCLWNLYRALNDLPPNRHLLDPLTWREVPGPFVRDFDFQDQYEDWRRTFDPREP